MCESDIGRLKAFVQVAQRISVKVARQPTHSRLCESHGISTHLITEHTVGMQNALEDFYRIHAPELVPKAKSVLRKFEGRERELQEKCKEKYGDAPAFPEKPASAKPATSRPSSARPTSSKPASSRPSSARPASSKRASSRPSEADQEEETEADLIMCPNCGGSGQSDNWSSAIGGWVPCARCKEDGQSRGKGTGKVKRDACDQTCNSCKGKGYISRPAPPPFQHQSTTSTCDKCNGRGKI